MKEQLALIDIQWNFHQIICMFLIYYIQNDKFLLKEIYERLPDYHKKSNGFFSSSKNFIYRGEL